jgi:hypothetical protein
MKVGEQIKAHSKGLGLYFTLPPRKNLICAQGVKTTFIAPKRYKDKGG